MITFTKEKITKTAYADQASRLTLCCFLLWILAIVFPVVYLVSIGNLSWPTNTYTYQTPKLSFKNYQLACEANDEIVYYTNLNGRQSSQTKTLNIGGASSDLKISVTIQLQNKNVKYCNGILYFSSNLVGSINNQFVGTFPFSIYSLNDAKFIQNAVIQSDIKVSSLSQLSQNYRTNSQTNSPFSSPYSTMEQNFVKLNSQSNSLTANNLKIKYVLSSNTSSTNINIKLSVQNQRFLISPSLLIQMRQFFRQWIYVFLPISFIVMLFLNKLIQFRVYPHRTGTAQTKQKIL